MLGDFQSSLGYLVNKATSFRVSQHIQQNCVGLLTSWRSTWWCRVPVKHLFWRLYSASFNSSFYIATHRRRFRIIPTFTFQQSFCTHWFIAHWTSRRQCFRMVQRRISIELWHITDITPLQISGKTVNILWMNSAVYTFVHASPRIFLCVLFSTTRLRRYLLGLSLCITFAVRFYFQHLKIAKSPSPTLFENVLSDRCLWPRQPYASARFKVPCFTCVRATSMMSSLYAQWLIGLGEWVTEIWSFCLQG